MAIGRLVSLLGLSPATLPPQQPEDPLHDKAVTSAGAGTDRQGPGQRDESDMSAQIRAVLGAIRQLHENASEDGAGMAFSHSGNALRGSIGALGHLLATARDSREVLPPRIIGDAVKVMDVVDADLERLGDAMTDRLRRLPVNDRDRAQDVTSRFMGEMNAAVALVRATIAGMR